MQSIVIVLLKAILYNVTTVAAQSQNGQNGVNGASTFAQEDSGFTDGRSRNQTQQPNGDQEHEMSGDDMEKARLLEITGKAVSGTLLLLLKWFKVSRMHEKL